MALAWRGPQNPPRPCRSLSVLLVALLTMQATLAFQVGTGLESAVRASQHSRCRLETGLSATSLPHQKPARTTRFGKEDDPTFPSDEGGSTTAKRKAAFSTKDWTALPLRRDELIRRSRELDRMELVVGRVAMVGATVFLFKELFTGESILEQVADAFTKVTT